MLKIKRKKKKNDQHNNEHHIILVFIVYYFSIKSFSSHVFFYNWHRINCLILWVRGGH